MWLAFKTVDTSELPSAEDQLTNSNKKKNIEVQALSRNYIYISWMLATRFGLVESYH